MSKIKRVVNATKNEFNGMINSLLKTEKTMTAPLMADCILEQSLELDNNVNKDSVKALVKRARADILNLIKDDKMGLQMLGSISDLHYTIDTLYDKVN